MKYHLMSLWNIMKLFHHELVPFYKLSLLDIVILVDTVKKVLTKLEGERGVEQDG
jgi:hypothetical protein